MTLAHSLASQWPFVSRRKHDEAIAQSDDLIRRLLAMESILADLSERVGELEESNARLERHNRLLSQTIARMQTEKT